MEKNLIAIIAKMKPMSLSNANYYKLIDLNSVLKQLGEIDIIVDEHIITPFYIYNQSVLELYDYELNIRQVNHPDVDNFLLSKTGKQSLDDVSPLVKKKIKNCYLETILPSRSLPVCKILEFIRYVRSSDEIRERIKDCLHEFCEDKLYFEIY